MLLGRQLPAASRAPYVASSKAPVPVTRVVRLSAAAPAEAATTAPAAAPAAGAPAPANQANQADQIKRRITLLQDRAADRKALGAALGKLQSEDGRLFMDPEGQEQVYRAVRLLCQASTLLAQQNANKVVEVVLSTPVLPASKQQGDQQRRGLRLSAGYVDTQAPVKPIVALPDSDRASTAKERNGKPMEKVMRVGGSTRLDGLAGAILDRLEAHGEVTMQAAGQQAVSNMVQALRQARGQARRNYGCNLVAYMSTFKLSSEAEEIKLGRGCQITVRPAPARASTADSKQ